MELEPKQRQCRRRPQQLQLPLPDLRQAAVPKLLHLSFWNTASLHLAHNVFDEMPERPVEPLDKQSHHLSYSGILLLLFLKNQQTHREGSSE